MGSKSSSQAEKLLAEMKDECKELTEDRANYAKGMKNANEALTEQADMQGSGLQRENEALEAEHKSLEMQLMRAKYENNRRNEELRGAKAAQNAPPGEIEDEVKSMRTEVESFREKLSKSEQSLNAMQWAG